MGGMHSTGVSMLEYVISLIPIGTMLQLVRPPSGTLDDPHLAALFADIVAGTVTSLSLHDIFELIDLLVANLFNLQTKWSSMRPWLRSS